MKELDGDRRWSPVQFGLVAGVVVVVRSVSLGDWLLAGIGVLVVAITVGVWGVRRTSWWAERSTPGGSEGQPDSMSRPAILTAAAVGTVLLGWHRREAVTLGVGVVVLLAAVADAVSMVIVRRRGTSL